MSLSSLYWVRLECFSTTCNIHPSTHTFTKRSILYLRHFCKSQKASWGSESSPWTLWLEEQFYFSNHRWCVVFRQPRKSGKTIHIAKVRGEGGEIDDKWGKKDSTQISIAESCFIVWWSGPRQTLPHARPWQHSLLTHVAPSLIPHWTSNMMPKGLSEVILRSSLKILSEDILSDVIRLLEDPRVSVKHPTGWYLIRFIINFSPVTHSIQYCSDILRSIMQ